MLKFAFLLVSSLVAQNAWAMPLCAPEIGEANNVSVRLEGEWQVDTALSERLGGADVSAGFSGLRYHPVSGIAERFELPTEFCALSEGVLALKGADQVWQTSQPAVVTLYRGNTMLVRIEGVHDNGNTDFESAILALALGRSATEDLLFFGEDHPLDGPSFALTRVR